MFPVFVFPIDTLPVLAVFSAFLACGSFRIIPMQTLGTSVPRADERARYMTAQTAVQHTSAAVGSIVSAQMLTEGPGGELIGMRRRRLVERGPGDVDACPGLDGGAAASTCCSVASSFGDRSRHSPGLR